MDFMRAAELMMVEAEKTERHENIRDTAGGESQQDVHVGRACGTGASPHPGKTE